jgi:hypothetical protein
LRTRHALAGREGVVSWTTGRRRLPALTLLASLTAASRHTLARREGVVAWTRCCRAGRRARPRAGRRTRRAGAACACGRRCGSRCFGGRCLRRRRPRRGRPRRRRPRRGRCGAMRRGRHARCCRDRRSGRDGRDGRGGSSLNRGWRDGGRRHHHSGLWYRSPGTRLGSGGLSTVTRCRSSGLFRREGLADLTHHRGFDGRGSRPDELALFLQVIEQCLTLDSELFRELVDPDLSHVSPRLWPEVRDEARAVFSAGCYSSLSAHRVLIGCSSALNPLSVQGPAELPAPGWSRQH